MQPQLFLPTARQTNWLLLLALLSLGEALYLRYLAIEYAQVSLACQAGLDTWLCATFRLVIVLFNYSAFGWIALGAALLNLLRPSILLVAVALAATAFGLVLHNANLAGVAAALLTLSSARPAPAAAGTQARAGRPRTTPPASWRSFRCKRCRPPTLLAWPPPRSPPPGLASAASTSPEAPLWSRAFPSSRARAELSRR